MADNNSTSPDNRWYPPDEPGDLPLTRDWKKLITNYVWDLNSRLSSVSSDVTNVSNNITQFITVNSAGNNNGNGSGKPPVAFGTHALRLTTTYSPVSYNGFVYVETDRNQAAYYSNGNAWVLLEGVNSGSFESRYTGLNTNDAGMVWLETGRNNIASAIPSPTYRWDGNNWALLYGAFNRNQNQIAALQATFFPANSNGGNDIGALVNVTDFHHELEWHAFSGTGNGNNTTTFVRVSGDLFALNNSWVGFPITAGNTSSFVASVSNNNTLVANNAIPTGNNLAWTVTAWAWGPHDDLRAGEGPIFREVEPYPLTGWQLYDGSNNVTYMRSDAALGTVANLPNLSGVDANNNAVGNTAFVQAGSNASGINVAVRPVLATIKGNINTANFNGTFTGDSQNFTTVPVTPGVGANAFSAPNPYTPTGNITGNLTANNITVAFFDANNNAVGNSTAISNNGQPASIVRRAWFRK